MKANNGFHKPILGVMTEGAWKCSRSLLLRQTSPSRVTHVVPDASLLHAWSLACSPGHVHILTVRLKPSLVVLCRTLYFTVSGLGNRWPWFGNKCSVKLKGEVSCCLRGGPAQVGSWGLLLPLLRTGMGSMRITLCPSFPRACVCVGELRQCRK